MAQLTEYKCPCCDGAIEFNANSQKLKCPYCGTEFDIETITSYNEEVQSTEPDDMQWETSQNSEWREGEADGLSVYVCNSCGGEIVADEHTAATSCPYCGNPVTVKGNLSGALKPDFVIPFKFDKKAAMEALKKHYSGKPLLPKIFKDQNHIEEIKGVYVPFWLFDADANAHIRYKATRTRFWSDSQYNYTETSHFSVARGGNLGFERVPVDGSTQMDDALMESIEPFNFSEAVDFQTAYLAGFLADKYDVDAEQSILRANERIKRSTEQAFASTVQGYSTVVPVSSSVKLSNAKTRYALYPVWMLTTDWNGQKFTFAMNGQTGKFVGDLPMDKGAFAKWFASVTAIAGAVSMAISYLVWLL
ncbi:MAG: hypothetical protein E7613_05860 [Ruminococcaceae bacterium]|nr:hypothetical protein [Oscillospiraceae bacterium]